MHEEANDALDAEDHGEKDVGHFDNVLLRHVRLMALNLPLRPVLAATKGAHRGKMKRGRFWCRRGGGWKGNFPRSKQKQDSMITQ